MTVGFVGIGTMGLPIATRLVDAGVSLVAWNRTPEKCAPLVARGVRCAASVAEVFEQCDIVFVMLLDEHAIDAALGRGSDAFACVGGRLVVTLGTTSSAYSAALAADVRTHGGRYVEAPVSGSRVPAQEGTLVGMVAGDAADTGRVEPLLDAFCRTVVRCGDVPAALRTKIAVNHYLIVMVAALAESVAAAAAAGVDLEAFRRVLDAGPMASAVSRIKLDKLVRADFSPQAAIRDVAQIAVLVRDQAHAAGLEAPLIDAAADLFDAARARGLGALDMAAVLQ